MLVVLVILVAVFTGQSASRSPPRKATCNMSVNWQRQKHYWLSYNNVKHVIWSAWLICIWGVSKSTFVILMVETWLLHHAHGSKGLCLVSSLILGVFSAHHARSQSQCHLSYPLRAQCACTLVIAITVAYLLWYKIALLFRTKHICSGSACFPGLTASLNLTTA